MGFICSYFPNLEVAPFDVDEDLDQFYETLDDKSRKWYIKEEENCREKLKFSLMDDENFENVKRAKNSEDMCL
jgi:hypothetical protein